MKFVPPTALLLVVVITIFMVSQGYGHHVFTSEVTEQATRQEATDKEQQVSLGEENEDGGGMEEMIEAAALIQVGANNNNQNQGNWQHRQANPPRQINARNGNGRRQYPGLQTRFLAHSRIDCQDHIQRNRDPLRNYRINSVPRNIREGVRRFLRRDWNNYNDIPCRDRNGNHNGLTVKNLMRMANNILETYGRKVFQIDYPHARHPITHVMTERKRTYAYLPASNLNQALGQPCTDRRLYESGHAPCTAGGITCGRNLVDSEMYLTECCPNAREYWSAWTPCYFCQLSLMAWKQATSPANPITIHFGKRYINNREHDKSSSENCFALMRRQGFIIERWNWNTFVQQAHIDPQSSCGDLVELIKVCRQEDDRLRTIRRMFNRVTRIFQSTDTDNDIRQRCPDTRQDPGNQRQHNNVPTYACPQLPG